MENYVESMKTKLAYKLCASKFKLKIPKKYRLKFCLRTNFRKTRECWEWTGAKCSAGYGYFQFNKQAYRAARLALMLVLGIKSTPLVTDHLCRNTKCVNPNHLEFVTQRENVLRGLRSVGHGKVCSIGHELAEGNLSEYEYKKGAKVCKVCKTAQRKVCALQDKEGKKIRDKRYYNKHKKKILMRQKAYGFRKKEALKLTAKTVV